jgi:CRISPR/Cas system CMR subunit Cmr6 (Cas7 group RAMP superfamily)
MNNFDLFIKGFMKVSLTLKYGNNSKFLQDLKINLDNVLKETTLEKLLGKESIGENLETALKDLNESIEKFLKFEEFFVKFIFFKNQEKHF